MGTLARRNQSCRPPHHTKLGGDVNLVWERVFLKYLRPRASAALSGVKR